MKLDIRVPMGWLFLSLGLILIVYGVASDSEMYVRHSLGQNINLRWGSVFVLFGGVALALAKRRS